MSHKDIFERERAGELISLDDPEYGKIAALITEAQQLIAQMNTGYRTPEEVRELFARLTLAVVFNKLDYDTQCAIAAGMVARECDALARSGFALQPEPTVSGVVIQEGYHERLGARPMRDATELLIRNALATELLRGSSGAGRLRAHPDGTKLQLESVAT